MNDQRLTRAAVATALVLLLTSGCGTPQSSGRMAEEQPPASSSAQLHELRTTAAKYLKASLGGDYRTAARYVAPSSRDILKAVALSAHARASSSDISVASVTVHGNAAKVKFTGRICQQSAPGAPKKCIENHRANTSNPVFVIQLARLDGKWLVVFGS